MKKVLPIADPPIKSYLHHAYALSVLATTDAYLPWFHSNYIQLHFNQKFKDHRFSDYFNFYYYPFTEVNIPNLQTLKIDRSILTGHNRLDIDFLTQFIDQGYYVCTYVDEYYIPNRLAYRTYHFKHEIFVYGYDRAEQVFHVLGFDRERVFQATTVSFEDFMEGHVNGYYPEHWWTNFIFPTRLKDEAAYPFNLQLVTGLLEDYLTSRSSDIRLAMHYKLSSDSVFGLACYDWIDKCLEMMENGTFFIDYRVPSVLWEHKYCMRLRLEYMHRLGIVDRELCQQYAKVESDALRARNLMLKAFVLNELSIISKVRQLVKSVHEQEVDLLFPLLHDLKKEVVCSSS